MTLIPVLITFPNIHDMIVKVTDNYAMHVWKFN